MVFLYSLLILILNVAIGWVILFPLKLFLFYPKKQLHMFKKPVKFSPGFLIRKKQWFLNKLQTLLNSYLAAASNPKNKESKIAKWEEKVYAWAYNTFDIKSKLRFVPNFIAIRLKQYSASIVLEVVSQFLRDFVPFLLKKYNVDSYIELIDKKINIDIIEEYFHRYIYKWLRLICTALWAIAGLYNMILFWFLG